MEIRSVSKAVRLIQALSEESGTHGVTDLARRLEMDKASVSRILRTLQRGGLVAQDETTRGYTLGLSLVHLGQKALRRLDLRAGRRIRPARQVSEGFVVAKHLLFLRRVENRVAHEHGARRSPMRGERPQRVGVDGEGVFLVRLRGIDVKIQVASFTRRAFKALEQRVTRTLIQRNGKLYRRSAVANEHLQVLATDVTEPRVRRQSGGGRFSGVHLGESVKRIP